MKIVPLHLIIMILYKLILLDKRGYGAEPVLTGGKPAAIKQDVLIKAALKTPSVCVHGLLLFLTKKRKESFLLTLILTINRFIFFKFP